jgi:hypothetical protein
MGVLLTIAPSSERAKITYGEQHPKAADAVHFKTTAENLPREGDALEEINISPLPKNATKVMRLD